MTLLNVFGRAKSFDKSWIGSKKLNQFGLHKNRIRLSDGCLKLRKRWYGPERGFARLLAKDGIVVLPDFLPDPDFLRLRKEVRSHFDDAECRLPLPSATEAGFGAKRSFGRGFDRFDGSTLNRFLHICEDTMPEAASFARCSRVWGILNQASGAVRHPEKFSLYQMVLGQEEEYSDNQKILHRDTFHHALKLWYFVEDVTEEDGPFEYVPGSHRMNKKRMSWEFLKSVRASSGARGHTKGGAFRASACDQRYMGLGKPKAFPVKANTLIIADVRGFHRRGHGLPGSRRTGLYANIRPHPFVPFPHP